MRHALPAALLAILALQAARGLAAPELQPGAIARRTPPPGAWRSVDLSPTDHFAVEEVRRWKEHRNRHRQVRLLAAGLDLVLYLLLLGALGRWLKRAADRLADRLAAPLGFLAPAGRMLRRAWHGPDWAGALLFAYLYFALGVAMDLPLSLWHEAIERQAGLSTYTAAGWATDFLKSLLVGCLLFSLLVLGLYGLIRRFPRRFWLILALPVALAMVGYGLLAPYATRLYHTVTPIERTRWARAGLAGRLQRLARSAGITLGQIKVIDTSRSTRALGAYLSGFGPTRELVLADTLLEAGTPDEIEVVVAHELGHVIHESLAAGTALAALALVGLLALLALVLRAGSRLLGLAGPGDIRTLPLLGLTVLLLFNLALPLRNLRAREVERQVDRTALVLTGNPRAFISLQVKLARRNQVDVQPSRWVELWLFGHPSTTERIGTALWYEKWLERRAVDEP